jgi:hypothetical protein
MNGTGGRRDSDGTMSIRLSTPEHLKLIGFLLAHTLIVIGLALSYVTTTDRRLASLEIRQEVTLEKIQEIKNDVKAIRENTKP